jgi:hypothetical protein
MSSNWPIVLIEGIMVFGGALAFAWWQLRDIKRDQKKAADERAARERAAYCCGRGNTMSTPSTRSPLAHRSIDANVISSRKEGRSVPTLSAWSAWGIRSRTTLFFARRSLAARRSIDAIGTESSSVPPTT